MVEPVVKVQAEDFDQAAEIRTMTEGRHDIGAVATFTGLCRSEGDTLSALELEHYPGMTEQQLETMTRDAIATHELEDALVIHRVGEILPGDDIVLVAAFSAHRKAAFDACRAMMETLKSTAPFWKKETLKSGERWVEKNTAG